MKDSEHTDEPTAKRLEGEKEEEFDMKKENTGTLIQIHKYF